nr:hypothetical protein [uncultured Lichenicoccus sp.]
MITILIIVLVVLALGGGGASYRAGYYGQGGFNAIGLLPLVLVILVVWLLLGHPGTV